MNTTITIAQSAKTKLSWKSWKVQERLDKALALVLAQLEVLGFAEGVLTVMDGSNRYHGTLDIAWNDIKLFSLFCYSDKVPYLKDTQLLDAIALDSEPVPFQHYTDRQPCGLSWEEKRKTHVKVDLGEGTRLLDTDWLYQEAYGWKNVLELPVSLFGDRYFFSHEGQTGFRRRPIQTVKIQVWKEKVMGVYYDNNREMYSGWTEAPGTPPGFYEEGDDGSYRKAQVRSVWRFALS